MAKYLIDNITKCWNWIGSLTPNGYGMLRRKGKTYRATRYFYTQYKGGIPSQLVLDHLCRNRRCVNPDHLEAVTQQTNIRRGLGTKINNDDIKKIREIYTSKELRQQEIADIYKVGQSVISRIVNRKRGYISA